MSVSIFKESKHREDIQKGWLYSNVYYLIELRDIANFIAALTENLIVDELISRIKIKVPPQGAQWTNRRIYECINALINFNIIDRCYKPLNYDFEFVEPSSKLSENDLNVFKRIYLSYPKFIDFHSLFIDNGNSLSQVSDCLPHDMQMVLLRSSDIVIAASEGVKYTNKFTYTSEEITYQIKQENTPLMVFWDVYIKWGKSLGLIEKIPAANFEFKVVSHIIQNNRLKNCNNVSFVYFINDTVEVDIKIFIEKHFRDKYIFIPELVLLLNLNVRFSVEKAKRAIVDYALNNRGLVSVERTSATFIKGSLKTLYPVINDSFISHLLFR